MNETWYPLTKPIKYKEQIYPFRIVSKFDKDHAGVDIAGIHKFCFAPTDLEIISIAQLNNKIEPSGVIAETTDYRFEFWHIRPDENLVVGSTVEAGTFLGSFMESDNGNFPHLHFAVYNKRKVMYVDPQPLLFGNTYEIYATET